MTEITETVVHLDTKGTAAALRQALKAAFPGVKFSVRMDRGSAYGWLAVGYVNGPSDLDVEAVVRPFESSRFDGSDDSTRATGNEFVTMSGSEVVRTIPSCRGVNVHRTITDEARDWALRQVALDPHTALLAGNPFETERQAGLLLRVANLDTQDLSA